MYFVFLLGLGFFIGVVGVASNPSSCFAVSALIVAAGLGCGMLADMGNFFLGVILYLVYLGGMLVVFAYSVALSVDPHPKAWGSGFAGVFMVCYLVVIGLVIGYSGYAASSGGCHYFVVSICDFDPGYGGVCAFYGVGWMSLTVVVLGMLLSLFVVLELVRGVSFVALKSG